MKENYVYPIKIENENGKYKGIFLDFPRYVFNRECFERRIDSFSAGMLGIRNTWLWKQKPGITNT